MIGRTRWTILMAKNCCENIDLIVAQSVRTLTNWKTTLTMSPSTTTRYSSVTVFHIHKSIVSRDIHRVAGALCRHLSQTMMFPSHHEQDAIQTSFFRKAGFPRISGIIDGTHVKMPRMHEDQYVNRKNYHSINVQVVCDHLSRIRNVVASWPGSTHDSRILSESKIGRDFEAGIHSGLLLGDSGYPCRPWIMTPFMNPLNAAQASNNLNSQLRCISHST